MNQGFSAAGSYELDAAFVRWNTLVKERIEGAHKLGIEVYAWGVTQPETVCTLLASNVDGIITDRFDTIRYTLDEIRNTGGYWASHLREWKCKDRFVTITGHRGSLSAMENTIGAFPAAVDAGAGMVEPDVRELKDGTLVVMHDETVDRTTDGTGCVKNLTYEQVKQLTAGINLVPTLDDVFARVPADLDIELKVSERDHCPVTHRTLSARSLVDTIQRNTDGRRVMVSSFDPGVIDTFIPNRA